MIFSSASRLNRALLAAAVASSLALVACTPEETGPATEAAVGLTVDAPRITVDSIGEGDREVITYRDIQEEPDDPEARAMQDVSVEVAEGFTQEVMRADAVDVAAPVGGDVDTLTLPLTGFTSPAAEADPENEERPATRDVELRVGQPSSTNLEQTDDIRSAEGFLVGWRGEDNGEVSTVRLAAPVDATDAGRATVEQSLMKLLSLPVVFPEEAVGPGAAWSVDSRVTGESTLLQTTTYTLVSHDGDTVELDVEVQQRPALGALEMEDGQSLSVLNANTTSQGTLTVDLTRPLPVDGEVGYTTRVIYGGPDSDVRVVQDSTTGLTFSPTAD